MFLRSSCGSAQNVAETESDCFTSAPQKRSNHKGCQEPPPASDGCGGQHEQDCGTRARGRVCRALATRANGGAPPGTRPRCRTRSPAPASPRRAPAAPRWTARKHAKQDARESSRIRSTRAHKALQHDALLQRSVMRLPLCDRDREDASAALNRIRHRARALFSAHQSRSPVLTQPCFSAERAPAPKRGMAADTTQHARAHACASRRPR
eukprot:4951712-Pleurochrysis_carterae.AAC.4